MIDGIDLQGRHPGRGCADFSNLVSGRAARMPRPRDVGDAGPCEGRPMPPLEGLIARHSKPSENTVSFAGMNVLISVATLFACWVSATGSTVAMLAIVVVVPDCSSGNWQVATM